MEEIIQILGTPAMNAFLAMMLVLITAGYAWTTVKILAANRAAVAAMNDQLEAQARPNVVVSLVVRPGTNAIFLVVDNGGQSRAEALSMKMDRDFFVNGEAERDNLATTRPFTGEAISLAPGSRLMFFFGVGPALLRASEGLCPRRISIRTSYRFGAKSYVEDHPLDWEAMGRTVSAADPIVEELRKLREAVVGLAQSQTALTSAPANGDD